MTLLIETGYGEAVDKYTILLLKRKKIKAEDKLQLIEQALTPLQTALTEYLPSIGEETLLLSKINDSLWILEDCVREGNIALYPTISLLNGFRHTTKNKIDEKLDSNIKEVKQYAQ